MTSTRLAIALLAIVPAAAAVGPVHAASSYDACTGFIPSLPTTISTQGVWCFNKDLATGVTSGNAITVATNNVTIDCNGFKLGGLAAGPATTTYGIRGENRTNVTVRDCNIRGFAAGVALDGESSGGGHIVERNRFDGNTAVGVGVGGDGSVIRGNLVRDTGGSVETPALAISGIVTIGQVDVLDNVITGTDGNPSIFDEAIGILLIQPQSSMVAGNRIGSMDAGEGGRTGIRVDGFGIVDIRSNTIGGETQGTSVACSIGMQMLHDNALLLGPPTDCNDGGDNYGWPVPTES